jgi:hypothetical protein
MRALVLLVLFVACKPQQAVGYDPDASPSASPSASVSVPTGPDAPKTKKKGEDCNVIFVSAERTDGGVIAAFAIDNTTAEELPVTVAGVQATSASGITGEPDLGKSKCSGIAPPHGRLACVTLHHFQDPPTRLRYRVEGAWFDVLAK